ncbi:septum formation inhibitor Maf [Pareuzebyella sediminis]|uniref:septum formation inhibitor Maf n=1 Tax=Pareuzebyella sediminis TaxID=2607998 RepID=UPI0011ECD364|nr:septum formation inhibitor Maf [Pareuzebyella sediminis]
MKKNIIKIFILFYISLPILLFEACGEKTADKKEETTLNRQETKTSRAQLSETFKKYWYNGEAEITSYQLEQARYGEMRDGQAVLIYVTEPFLAGKQVKADESHPDNVSVLKLNSTKNYLTGIYPYSIMTSSFYPVYDDQHAIKISFSSQEWCGQVYAQLNNRENFDVTSHSYFETEADQNLSLEKNILENELWNKIRINPENLPLGQFEVVPSFEYIRLSHKEFRAYNATLARSDSLGVSSYTINYPALERTLRIDFKTAFPHTIEGWSETFKSGFGENAKVLTSKATKMKTIKTPYWQQNGNKHLYLRDSLALK